MTAQLGKRSSDLEDTERDTLHSGGETEGIDFESSDDELVTNRKKKKSKTMLSLEKEKEKTPGGNKLKRWK